MPIKIIDHKNNFYIIGSPDKCITHLNGKYVKPANFIANVTEQKKRVGIHVKNRFDVKINLIIG
jgi:hypothetical protein